ncbi:MAG: DUF2497 domain-containing protein [Hyphomicrobiales bacterium]|nr:DUF2497 domain-containing protein [Hyphomicrobiales bacterium]
MRKPGQSSEPSIEEILASIRDIISEDGTSSTPSNRSLLNEPVRQSSRDLETASFEEDAKPSETYSNTADAMEAREDSLAEGGDEIFELTEDFMLAEEMVEAPAVTPKNAEPDDLPEELQAPPALPDFLPEPTPEEDDLDEVLSNLAIEVERLAAPEAAQNSQNNPESSAEPRQAVSDNIEFGPSDAASEDAKNFGAPDFTEPEQMTAQPQNAAMVEPSSSPSVSQPPASHLRQPQQAFTSKTRTVWSARRLENPSAPAAKTQSVEKVEDIAASTEESEAAKAASPLKSSPVSRRDLWAEGVQMPVPDTGPEMPLPIAKDENETFAEQDEPGEDKPSVSADRRTVGKFLTRVFGSAPVPEAEEPPEGETELRARAKQLAHDTVSDFAEEKLNAPSVGNALKADQEFMDEVALSLESALASPGEIPNEMAEANDAASGLQANQDAEADLQEPTAQDADLDLKMKEALVTDGPANDPDETDQPQEMAAEVTEMAAEAEAEEIETVEAAAIASTEIAETVVEEDVTVQAPAEISAEPQILLPDEKAGPPMPALNLPASLESSIKEMIKPLLIQWLNDNLLRIVEEAVREELSDRTEIVEARKRSSG